MTAQEIIKGYKSRVRSESKKIAARMDKYTRIVTALLYAEGIEGVECVYHGQDTWGNNLVWIYYDLSDYLEAVFDADEKRVWNLVCEPIAGIREYQTIRVASDISDRAIVALWNWPYEIGADEKIARFKKRRLLVFIVVAILQLLNMFSLVFMGEYLSHRFGASTALALIITEIAVVSLALVLVFISTAKRVSEQIRAVNRELRRRYEVRHEILRLGKSCIILEESGSEKQKSQTSG
jgi:hypothetical protein